MIEIRKVYGSIKSADLAENFLDVQAKIIRYLKNL